ncbi:MAG: ExbD/TolR family protein [Desulfovibrionaceae bacterium]
MFDIDDEDSIELDLTPLIDVIFLLLIFFIMATTFTKPVIEIALPEAQSAEQNKKRQAELVVAITKEGDLFYENTKISYEQFIELFDKFPERYLNLYVDKQSPFEVFLRVVEQVKIKRNGEFIITTEEK